MIRSTQNHHRAAWAALATAGALCMALTLTPAAAAQDVIDVRAGSAAIDFEPTVAHGGLVLTVSGPDGFYHREEFGAGESASFSIFDQDGGALPDGSYTWELTAAPTDVQRREALEANRLESRSQTQGITPVVESGSFAVIGGSLVAGGVQEPGAERPATAAPESSNTLATKDFVINDDLIVTGSECVGFDCVNGESFGFDTIRLKENNLRIKFEDTSTAGSFPTNDWELVANDSASGGLSRFSIRDVDASRNVFTVEAGAPNNALYVESSGEVGVGTSNPVLDLHVSTGDSPGLRLEQNSSSGFQAQIFDIAGNEANFFVRDTTNGSRLPFRIRPGAPTSSIDIAANGNVGMGTTAPQGPLHIKQGADDVALVDVGGTAASGTTLQLFSPDGSSGTFFSQALDSGLVVFGAQTNSNFAIRTNATTDVIRITTVPRVGILNTSPVHPLQVGTDATNGAGAHVTAAGVWTNGSSRQNKTSIRELDSEEAVTALEQIQPVRYYGANSQDDEEYLGFIAEDVPELVAMKDRASLASMDVVAMLTAVVKQQREAMKTQTRVIEELAARVEALEAGR